MTNQKETNWNEEYLKFLARHNIDTDEDEIIRMVFKHLKWRAITLIDDDLAIVFIRDLDVRLLCVPLDHPIQSQEFVETCVNPRFTLREVAYDNPTISSHFNGQFVAYQLDLVHKNIALTGPQQAYYSGTGWWS